ncbi:MAG: MFS transporter [Acidobacteriota bacterium]
MTQDAVEAQEYQYPRKQVIWGLVAIFAVYGAMAFSVQTMAVARPKIAAALDGLSLYGWSASIPALVMAISTIVFGKLSDIYGRRLMLMISLATTLVGTVLSALSPNFIFLIVATSIAAMGAGAKMPLVFAVVGDLFPPKERGKWVGLLNIPLGVFTLTGPALGGYIVDNLSWRWLFWMLIPLLIFCLITVPKGVPSRVQQAAKRKIDFKGCIWATLASSSAIIGFSLTRTYGWMSTLTLSLLAVSLVFWIIFLRIESGADEPVLDPEVLKNRSFRAVALATFFSSFGTMGMMMYFPMFLQGVQDVSAFYNGLIIIPYGVLTAFMGVPVGYLIAKTGRFKWMYISGYGILTASMFVLILFNSGTAIVFSVAIALLAGLGYGVIPTINTVVVQNAVPKRLMGAAMGAIFFFLMMGNAISPAILDPTLNVTYAKNMSETMPAGLRDIADENTLEALDDPQVLLSGSAMENLKNALEAEDGGPALFEQTVEATRESLQAGIRNIFWISAVFMLLAFLIICTVPRNSSSQEDSPRPE